MNNIHAQNAPHDTVKLAGGDIAPKFTHVEPIQGVRSILRLYPQDNCKTDETNDLPAPSIDSDLEDTKDEPHPPRSLTSIASSIRSGILRFVGATKTNFGK